MGGITTSQNSVVLDNLTFYPNSILIVPLTEIAMSTKPSSKEASHSWIEEMRHGAKEGRSRKTWGATYPNNKRIHALHVKLVEQD